MTRCVTGDARNSQGYPVGFQVEERCRAPHCGYCLVQREGLCDSPVFTGYNRDGGYAEYAAADANYCLALGKQ